MIHIVSKRGNMMIDNINYNNNTTACQQIITETDYYTYHNE